MWMIVSFCFSGDKESCVVSFRMKSTVNSFHALFYTIFGHDASKKQLFIIQIFSEQCPTETIQEPKLNKLNVLHCVAYMMQSFLDAANPVPAMQNSVPVWPEYNGRCMPLNACH